MRTITKILGVEKRTSQAGKDYFITLVLDSSGDESEGFGKEFKVGDRVEVWFEDRYNKAKCQLYTAISE